MYGGVGSPEGGGPTTSDMGGSVVRSPEGVSSVQAPQEAGRVIASSGLEAPAGGASLLVQETQAPQTPAPEAPEPAAPESPTAASAAKETLLTLDSEGAQGVVLGVGLGFVEGDRLAKYDDTTLELIAEGLRKKVNDRDPDVVERVSGAIADIEEIQRSRAASAPGEEVAKPEDNSGDVIAPVEAVVSKPIVEESPEDGESNLAAFRGLDPELRSGIINTVISRLTHTPLDVLNDRNRSWGVSLNTDLAGDFVNGDILRQLGNLANSPAVAGAIADAVAYALRSRVAHDSSREDTLFMLKHVKTIVYNGLLRKNEAS